MMRAILGGGVMVGTLLLALPAAADTENARLRVVFDAPANVCPDRAAFLAEILARTSRSVESATNREESDEPATVVHVTIEATGESSTGSVEIREPDGTEETRSVTSRTCAEVTKALALVTALVLDRDARHQPEPRAAPPPQPPPPSPEQPPLRPPPKKKKEWQASAGGELGALGGIGPAVAPMAGAFMQLDHATLRGLMSSARLTFDVARTSSDLAIGGTQTYEWLGGNVRLCPVVFAHLDRFRAAPCAAFQVAAHRATTQQVRNPSTSVDLWLAPVAAGSLAWSLTPDVALELQGGVLFPLQRTRYFLAPSTTIFTVPAVAGTVDFGVRVRFL